MTPADAAEMLASYWSLTDWFIGILRDHARVAIAGGPKSGKTTLSRMATDRPVFSTDDLIGATDWAGAPAGIMQMVAKSPDRYVVEGVQVPRALRKGLTPDAVVWLGTPRVELTPGQDAMRKGTETVMRDWMANGSAGIAVYGWTP